MASAKPSENADPVVPDRSIVYKTVGETELRLHAFEPRDGGSSGSRPCIVFFFGGGWRNGSPEQFYPHCRYLASRGLVALAAEYRVEFPLDRTNPFDCVTDGKSVVRWIRVHATDLGVDPVRIAAGGGSAGGHVAAACATSPSFDDESDDVSISAQPNALVLFNPVFDNGPTGFGHDLVKERWREFSPLHNIRSDHPPTVVFVGSEDGLVPVATATDYKERMAAVGARCELYVYPGQPHGFFNYRDGENPHYYATVCEADRFLASLGFAEGVPTLGESHVEVVHS